MLKNWKNNLQLLIVYSLVAFAIAYMLLGEVLFNLNSTQLDRSGDGFKNYFTFAYQYIYGEGVWFEGMQYPFGDLLMYADGQASILLPLKALNFIGIDLSNHLLFVVQSLPLFSIVLAGILLHKIMRHYKTPEWWTFVTVIFCLTLSPQLFRLNSHFALSYLFCFPLIWYLLLKFDKQEISKVTYFFASSTTLLFIGFIHPYLLLICGLFLLAWFFIQLLQRDLKLTVGLSAIFSIVLFMIISTYLDPFTDRPQNPWGIWKYKTEISDLFPFYGWLRNIFEGSFSVRTYYSEGYAYLGVLIFIVPFLFTYQKLKKIRLDFNSSYFLAALLMLLFAMGVHLLITNQLILKWLPPLKQFRSLGRFAWAFYYVGFISFSAYFFHWTQRIDNKIIRNALLVFVIGFWAIDAYSYNSFFKHQIREFIAPNELLENKIVWNALKEKNIDLDRFQAVLPLPVSLEGVEKLTTKDNWFVKIATIPFVYQTGIPMFGAHMSRTSISNAMKTLALTSSSYIDKEICDFLTPEKDILIIVNKEDIPEFEDIVSRAKYINSTEVLEFYSITTKDICKSDFISPNQDIENKALLYSTFKSENSTGLLSAGAKKISGTQLIGETTLPDSTTSITSSIWIRIDAKESSGPFFNFNFLDAKDKKISSIYKSDKDIKRSEVIGNWAQLKFTLDVPEGAHSVKWFCKAQNLFVDHALITLDKSHAYIPLENNHVISNHHIGKLNTKTIEK